MSVKTFTFKGGFADGCVITMWDCVTCLLLTEGRRYVLKSDGALHYEESSAFFNPPQVSASGPVCECGGDKTKTGHSYWCPIYGS